ncbi:MAG: PQQ-dependent catabolism-associated CXXCW motif protein, partial [Methylocystis sp.]
MSLAKHLASGLLALCAAVALCASPAIAQAPPEPEGYRLDNYHAPTPATLKGATVLDTPQAFELWSGKKAVFIDALSRPPKPEGLPKNAVWRDPKRFDIPGSIWLPDTGFGELSEPMARYF